MINTAREVAIKNSHNTCVFFSVEPLHVASIVDLRVFWQPRSITIVLNSHVFESNKRLFFLVKLQAVGIIRWWIWYSRSVKEWLASPVMIGRSSIHLSEQLSVTLYSLIHSQLLHWSDDRWYFVVLFPAR